MRGSAINIDITRKCTLKCRHCYNHSGEMNNDELTSDELFRIMNDLASTRPDNFCICGGEPLLKKEIINIKYTITIKVTIFIIKENSNAVKSY